MRILFSISLRLFHWIYTVYLFLCSWHQQRQRQQPRPLLATRRRLPHHLAIILITPPQEPPLAAITESVANAVIWCRQLGIGKLTVYEEHGSWAESEHEIRSRLAPVTIDSESSESEVEYRPLTPPPSDYSESRPLSPSHPSVVPVTRILISDSSKSIERSAKKHGMRRRRGVDEKLRQSSLQLCLASRDASKGAIAAVATSLARSHRLKQQSVRRPNDFNLSVEALDAILEGDEGLSSPDFMIVHSLTTSNTTRRVPLELHGFPPWHIRLTEIYCSRLYDRASSGWFSLGSTSPPLARPLDQSIFCEALDEYAGAEMRFGK